MATEKKSFIIRIDAETLAAVEKWAADEFRSTNGQIEWILSETLKKAKRGKAQKETLPSVSTDG
ncbi:MAG: DNA-binding protein [Lentimicrobiaceae bacterium]|nr:DNA-binding protein [Lentimicrobiaceae bacterium]